MILYAFHCVPQALSLSLHCYVILFVPLLSGMEECVYGFLHSTHLVFLTFFKKKISLIFKKRRRERKRERKVYVRVKH